jgi:hypothetical protein
MTSISNTDKNQREQQLLSEIAATKEWMRAGKTLADKINLKNMVSQLEDALFDLKCHWFDDTM